MLVLRSFVVGLCSFFLLLCTLPVFWKKSTGTQVVDPFAVRCSRLQITPQNPAHLLFASFPNSPPLVCLSISLSDVLLFCFSGSNRHRTISRSDDVRLLSLLLYPSLIGLLSLVALSPPNVREVGHLGPTTVRRFDFFLSGPRAGYSHKKKKRQEQTCQRESQQ